MKKLLSLLCATALLGSTVPVMVGCGNDEYYEEGATEIVIYLQDFEEWENNHTKQMINEFNSIMDDGIQLVPRFFQDEAYPDALSSARENGKAPDIFVCSYGNLYGTVVSKNHAAPLNDLLDQAYFDDIVDSVKPMVTFGDNIYAYPQLTEPSAMLFYRKSVLSKAGVTEAPKSWADLLDVCGKVKPVLKKGQYTLGLPINSALGWATYGLQYNASGNLVLNDEWTECLVDTEGYRELCGLWYDLYAGGYVPAGNVSARGYNDIIEGLCQDKLAMTFAGSWSMATIVNSYGHLKDDIGYIALPTLSGNTGETTASNGGWTYCISSTSKNKEKAARVLEYLFCEDAARTARYFEAASYSKIAVNKKVQQHLTENVKDGFADWLQTVNAVAATAIPEPTYAWDISLSVSSMLEYMALNTNANKAKIIEEQISFCKEKIERLMTVQGPNPAFPR
ncbi:ABC transporter substrate-binding protein [Anaerocaecibacter muris]|uniref:ABC transporter substrate-binding protein n=1 Tax=Anaerocaecibacter muris TaxID=2941513 RepID=UPI003F69281F